MALVESLDFYFSNNKQSPAEICLDLRTILLINFTARGKSFKQHYQLAVF
jgi:hypothetical protein